MGSNRIPLVGEHKPVFVEKAIISKARKAVHKDKRRGSHHLLCEIFCMVVCLLLGVIRRKMSPCGRGCKESKMISWRLAKHGILRTD